MGLRLRDGIRIRIRIRIRIMVRVRVRIMTNEPYALCGITNLRNNEPSE